MTDYNQEFKKCSSVNECLKLRDSYNKSGEFLDIKKSFATANSDEKKELGKKLGILRNSLQNACDRQIHSIQKEQEKDNYLEYDPTFYSQEYKNGEQGSQHPLSLVLDDIVAIFSRMGFDVFDGPLVTSQYRNFTYVNIPDYHPARDMQDTFFLNQKDSKGENYVLRTHVTANISRYVETHKPPFRTIFPGIVFRNENMDATHDINFTQFDMWMVDKNTSISQLSTLIKTFFNEFFGKKDMNVRLRQNFFPFTEPSFEGDISCPFCSNGCRICKNTKWIEVFGAGPIHKNVIENMGLDSSQYQGLAFGFGVDRLAQMKLHLSTGRPFYDGDLKFLKGVK